MGIPAVRTLYQIQIKYAPWRIQEGESSLCHSQVSVKEGLIQHASAWPARNLCELNSTVIPFLTVPCPIGSRTRRCERLVFILPANGDVLASDLKTAVAIAG